MSHFVLMCFTYKKHNEVNIKGKQLYKAVYLVIVITLVKLI